MDNTVRLKLRKHIDDMKTLNVGSSTDAHQRVLSAEIQFLIAEEQAKSSEKVERQTDTLINLTRWLFRLTWILVVFDGWTARIYVFPSEAWLGLSTDRQHDYEADH